MSITWDRRIVVGFSDPESSLAAAEAAAVEASRHQLPLLLLSAHPFTEHPGPHTALSVMLRRLCMSWPELAITAHNQAGDPAEVLLDASREAALVVVGRRAGEQVSPIVSQLAAHSWCPTLLVPADGRLADRGPVMVGVGMSPADEPALGYAFEAAASRGRTLVAVYVWSGIPTTGIPSVNPFAYRIPHAVAAADRLVAEALAGWAEKYPDVPVDRMPLYDANPARALVDASRQAGLVVVGGRSAIASSQLLGPVSRALLQHAACPVAVVRSSQIG